MKALIVGCGLGGLTAAIALRRRGHHVTIVEQAPAAGEVGAGLQVPPNATRVLEEIGALDRVRRAAVRPQYRVVRDGVDGSEIHRKELGDAVERETGAPYLVLHRADFLDALLATALDPRADGSAAVIEFGQRVEGVDDTPSGVVVRATSGASWTADLVIGADGIHSTVRGLIGELDSPTYSGESMWRALVPAGALDDELRELAGVNGPATTIWAGPSRHVVDYPLRSGTLVNIAATLPGHQVEESYTASGRVEDMVASYDGWDPRLIRLLGHAPSARLWPLFVREPLEHWTAGRIALVGDAAHPMLPYQAQGSAQAIEDASVLADSLTAEPDDVAGALARYEMLRKPRASAIQVAAVRSGEAWGVTEDAQLKKRDEELREMDGNSGSVTYDWLWQGSPTQAPQVAG